MRSCLHRRNPIDVRLRGSGERQFRTVTIPIERDDLVSAREDFKGWVKGKDTGPLSGSWGALMDWWMDEQRPEWKRRYDAIDQSYLKYAVGNDDRNVRYNPMRDNPTVAGKPKLWYPKKGSPAAKDLGSLLQQLRRSVGAEKDKLRELFKKTRLKWMARDGSGHLAHSAGGGHKVSITGDTILDKKVGKSSRKAKNPGLIGQMMASVAGTVVGGALLKKNPDGKWYVITPDGRAYSGGGPFDTRKEAELFLKREFPKNEPRARVALIDEIRRRDETRDNPALVVIGNPARKYGLFEKDANGKWVRVMPDLSLKKNDAVRVWQNALLAGALGGGPERCLKPVKSEPEDPRVDFMMRPSRENPLVDKAKFKQKEVFNYIRSIGMTIKKDDAGDYVVNVKGGKEATAYYTPDLDDAIHTASYLRGKHRKNPSYITDPEGDIIDHGYFASKEAAEKRMNELFDKYPDAMFHTKPQVRFSPEHDGMIGDNITKHGELHKQEPYENPKRRNTPPGAVKLPKKLERQVMNVKSASDRAEIMKGIEKFYDFHGCFPPKLIVKNVDHAKLGVPKVCVALGRGSKVDYTTDNTKSNKFFAGGKGQYVHRFGEGLKGKARKNAKPLLVTDPSGKTLTYLPSLFRVKDWIHH